jgi:hypothetical protein
MLGCPVFLVDDAHWNGCDPYPIRCLLSMRFSGHQNLCSQFYHIPQDTSPKHHSLSLHILLQLIPPPSINLIHQLPPTPRPPHILPQDLKRALSIHIRTATDMRRNQHIWCRPQRVISRQRLRVRDVKSRAADEAVFERLDERRLVDDLAARDIGDECAARVGLVEQVEFVGGEEVGCGFAAGC